MMTASAVPLATDMTEKTLPFFQDTEGIFSMTAEDISTVAEIEANSFTMPWSLNAFHSTLRCPTTAPFVYRKGGQTVGYAICSTVFEMAELYNIAVDIRFRNEGIGSKLLDFIIQHCKNQGAENLFLEVRRSNESARKLYEKKGFIIDSVRKNYYKNPVEDAILMHLSL